jgi:hypothetical protein
MDIKKAYSSRVKKERKTIKDGDNILQSIIVALKEGKTAYGFTMGKISLIQIVEHIAKEFGGNFELKTCIWSANRIDILRLKELKDKKFLSSARFLVDPSAYTRKFSAIEELYKSFGEESVRSVPTHAKFVTLKNDKYSIAITSSMNFTHNPRIEQYDITECIETVELMSGMIDSSFEAYKPEDNFTSQSMSQFKKIKKSIAETDNFDLGIELDLNLNLDLKI